MVRSKSLAAASGRKQRIECIVKNLSDRIMTKTPSLFNGPTESPSVLFEQRMESSMCSTTWTSDLTDSVYHLPAGLEFCGVVCAKTLSQGRKFGPFTGKITPKTVQPSFDYSFVCQVPDVDGNFYNLNLLGREMDSYRWLKSLQRFSSYDDYNAVMYNTPSGVILETVAEVGEGIELCIAYDQSCDVAEVSQASNGTEQMENIDQFNPLSVGLGEANEAELFISSGTPVSPYSNTIALETDDAAEIIKDSKLTYNVMTADVAKDNSGALKSEDKKNVLPKERQKKAVRSKVKKEKESRAKVAVADSTSKKNPSFRAYRCTSCKHQFETFEKKQEHLEKYHSRECPVCHKSYTRAYLKEHMMFHLESSRVTCPMCFKVFSSVSNLRKHEKKHSRRGVCAVSRKKVQEYQCTECPKRLKSKKQLEMHRKKHVRIVPISCSDCGRVFSHKSLLRQHQIAAHQGKKPYTCQHCNKTFTQSGNLARHRRHLHGDKKEVISDATRMKFLCRRRGCDQKSFTSRELFIKHLEQHSGVGCVYPCPSCRAVFSSASNLSKHKNAKHPCKPSAPVGRKVSCKICKQSFQNEHVYRRHLRNHKIKKRENKCEACGKKFASQSGVLKHRRLLRCPMLREAKSSKPSKANRCSSCSKTFASVLELRKHRRCHVPRRYTCELCGRLFSDPGNLGKHRRHVHQVFPRPKEEPKSKRFTCETCKKPFANSSALKVHKRDHVQLKPFKCNNCDRNFSNKGGLAKHALSCQETNTTASSMVNQVKPIVEPLTTDDEAVIRAREKSIKCDLCERRFSNNGGKAKHMLSCSKASFADSIPNQLEPIVEPLISDNGEDTIITENMEQSLIADSEAHALLSVNTDHSLSPGNTEECTIIEPGDATALHDFLGEGLVDNSVEQIIVEPPSPVF